MDSKSVGILLHFSFQWQLRQGGFCFLLGYTEVTRRVDTVLHGKLSSEVGMLMRDSWFRKGQNCRVKKNCNCFCFLIFFGGKLVPIFEVPCNNIFLVWHYCFFCTRTKIQSLIWVTGDNFVIPWLMVLQWLMKSSPDFINRCDVFIHGPSPEHMDRCDVFGPCDPEMVRAGGPLHRPYRWSTLDPELLVRTGGWLQWLVRTGGWLHFLRHQWWQGGRSFPTG